MKPYWRTYVTSQIWRKLLCIALCAVGRSECYVFTLPLCARVPCVVIREPRSVVSHSSPGLGQDEVSSLQRLDGNLAKAGLL